MALRNNGPILVVQGCYTEAEAEADDWVIVFVARKG